MTVTRVNNRYFESQRSQYLKDLKQIDPFQDAVPCWHPLCHTQQQLDCGLYGWSNRYY